MWIIVGIIVFFLFGIGGFIEWRRKRINNHPHISTSSATRPGESQNYTMDIVVFVLSFSRHMY